MKIRTVLSIITGVIFLFGLFSLQYEFIPNRWFRVITSGFFLVYAVKVFSFAKPFGLAIFLLLFSCDMFLLFWEQSILKLGYYINHTVAIGILIFLTLRELKWPKISGFEIFSLLLFFAVNTGILLFLGSYFNSGIEDLGLRFLFYTNGFLILVLVLSVFLYSIHFANDVSAFLFIAVIGLTVSDLLLFGIYFLDYEEFRYLDNIFYTLGLYFLLSSYLEHRKQLKEKEDEKNDPEGSLREEKEATAMYV